MMKEIDTSQEKNRRRIIIGIFHGNIPGKPDGNGGKPIFITAFSKV